MTLLKSTKYFMQGIYASHVPSYKRYDEFGHCTSCGRYSRFKYGPLMSADSPVALSCGWDEHFVHEINVTNSLACSYCFAKFRVRCAAQSLLAHFWRGRVRSIADLVRKLRSGAVGEGWRALETTARSGIFSEMSDCPHVVRSEYFDDVPRGQLKDGVRSEDLQALTFPDSSFDAVIALDVFEHIADPMKAFAEVLRVIKPGGIGLFTVPLDERITTTRTLATLSGDRIACAERRAFHSDPLRTEGSPVFTEFGMDLEANLRSSGFMVSCDTYTTRRSGVRQRVFFLHKSVGGVA